MNWTTDQEHVITARGRNLLVSAAAGSGKTAVLVARIFSLLTDPKHPADIDDLLIVTFTKAAAAQMKERIGARISEALEEDPENEHLQRQSMLLHNAQITTIDGFCAYVIRNYAGSIDLDPGFRIAEEGEIKLLKSDVMRELLEEAYAAGGTDSREKADSAGDTDSREKADIPENSDSREKADAAGGTDSREKEDTSRDTDSREKADIPENSDSHEMVSSFETPGFRDRFVNFVETFATGKSDRELDDLILQAYEKAQSTPYPEEWLDMCAAEKEADSMNDLNGEPWMADLWASVDSLLCAGRALAAENQEIIEKYPFRPIYRTSADNVSEIFDTLTAAGHDYGRFFHALADAVVLPLRAGGKAPAEENAEMRELFKEKKGECGAILKDLAKDCFFLSPELALEFHNKSLAPLRMLIDLTKQFSERFAQEKRKRNVVDFSDLEHFALEILREKKERTPAAKELAKRYLAVMIDEYQDSNYLQEEILTAVSGIEDGNDNYFCVGDVKQSIYSFRQARPDLFMKKFRDYGEGRDGLRIDLHRNFRSRAEILDVTNGIFRQIMRREIGGIEYDASAALISGIQADILAENETGASDPDVEILTVFTGDEDAEGEQITKRSYEQRKIEARAIAERIRGIVGSEELEDAAGGKRKVEYRDIVILLRTMEGWSETFARTLIENGIPAYNTASTGYFGTQEVSLVLAMLSVIDNPRQDIPLAAVLTSAPVGLTSREMALIRRRRAEAPSAGLYEDVCFCAENGEREELRKKLSAFLSRREEYRVRARCTPLHEFISQLLSETGYGDYVLALPGGTQRAANLRLLIERATAYEKTSYMGLFNFVRYIRKMQKVDIDFGEASAFSEKEDAVRIISIHKSKGLEYPVVFVAGMGKKMNTGDLKAPVLLHPEYGFASYYTDYEKRLRYPTLKRYGLAQRLLSEMKGEELRVLYVAMTRAKSKLILCGILKDRATLEKRKFLCEESGHPPVNAILTANCYWDWILPAAQNLIKATGYPLAMTEMSAGNLSESASFAGWSLTEALDQLKACDAETVCDPQMREALEKRFSFAYPYEDRAGIPVKVSVSELKHADAEALEEGVWVKYEEPEVIPLIPEFMKEGKEKETLKGSGRGTAYHKFLARLTYPVAGYADLAAQLARCAEKKWLTEEEAGCIFLKDIDRFCQSPLGKRMAGAAVNGKLKREQPFVMAVPAARIDVKWPESEKILVQGIIDAYFTEEAEDGIVLVDYKTDRVETPEELTGRYAVQLNAYAEALSRATGLPVKEKLLYSFALGKSVEVQ